MSLILIYFYKTKQTLNDYSDIFFSHLHLILYKIKYL